MNFMTQGQDPRQAASKAGALAGIKVLDLSRILGGPLCGQILGDHGADVLKVEPPQGDDTRAWGPPFNKDGVASYYFGLNRNKRIQFLDLSAPDGQQRVRELMARADVVVENFKAGTMEKWGIGYEQVRHEFPHLVWCRVTGFGTDGPLGALPGYDAAVQAMAGLMSINGDADGDPLRVGLPVVDMVTGMNAVIGVLLALQARARIGRGQVVDVALFEAVFNCMESLLPEYSAFGAVREPAGSALPGIAPSNAYRCADGQVVIGGNGDSIYRRLMSAIGRADLAEAPDLASNAGRVARVDEIDAAITQWTVQRPVDAVVAALQAVQVPVGRIYTVRDIAADPHYRARQMIERIVTADGLALEVPGVVPKLGDTPGGLFRPAPRLGEHDGEGWTR